jgi:hypothetical protein
MVSLGTPGSANNKTYHCDINEILLKVAFNTLTLYERGINPIKKSLKISKG